jgi:hypothetical protein
MGTIIDDQFLEDMFDSFESQGLDPSQEYKEHVAKVKDAMNEAGSADALFAWLAQVHAVQLNLIDTLHKMLENERSE